MSPEAITKRLKIVNVLGRTCLSLANSSAEKSIQKKIPPEEAELLIESRLMKY